MLGRQRLGTLRRVLAKLPADQRDLALQLFVDAENLVDDVVVYPSYLGLTATLLIVEMQGPKMGFVEEGHRVAAGMCARLGAGIQSVISDEVAAISEAGDPVSDQMSMPEEFSAPLLELPADEEDAVAAFGEHVSEWAFDGELLAALVPVGADLWFGVTSIATFQMQKNAKDLSLAPPGLFDHENVAALMALGYVVACADAYMGAEPFIPPPDPDTE